MKKKNVRTYKGLPTLKVVKEISKDICRCPNCNSLNVKLLKVVADKDNSKDIYNTPMGKDHLSYKYYICKECGHRFSSLGIEGC